jgi:hypothetical protein
VSSSPSAILEPSTINTWADVTITLEPGVEQTFRRAMVEVMPPKPSRPSDKTAVMILIWVDPAELHLRLDSAGPPPDPTLW